MTLGAILVVGAENFICFDRYCQRIDYCIYYLSGGKVKDNHLINLKWVIHSILVYLVKKSLKYI
jgi:hypothetical protein